MRLQRVLLTVPALAVMGPPVMAADLSFTNDNGTTATFYGQVNLTFQGVDDGEETYQNLVDNSNSPSRVGLWIDGELWGNRARFNFETALGIKGTSETSQNEDADWFDWQRTDIRKLEIVYSGDFGSVWAGQGSMATDGVAEIDNSGTSVVGYAALADTAGGFLFRDGPALSGVNIGSVFKDFDGPRRFRLRYDTPEYSGFTASAAVGDEVLSETDDASYYDAALRYGYDDDVVSFDAGIGYSWKDDDGVMTEQLAASASGIHQPTGLNLTLAAGEQMSDEGQFLYAKIGWRGDVLAVGETALSADIYNGNDFGVSGSTSDSWGLQAVQQFSDYGLEAYLGYREYSYEVEAPGNDYEELSAVLFGARWKF
jgi:hypothetical protein